jgi:hypothetical protein
MLFSQQMPADGQLIVATNETGGCWVEEFDSHEPLGQSFAWFPISKEDFDEHLDTQKLFIRMFLSSISAG